MEKIIASSRRSPDTDAPADFSCHLDADSSGIRRKRRASEGAMSAKKSKYCQCPIESIEITRRVAAVRPEMHSEMLHSPENTESVIVVPACDLHT